MGFNFGSIKTKVRSIITDLLADDGLAVTITFTQDLGVTWSDALSRNVAQTTSTQVSAIRTRHNRRSVQVFEARVEEGDVVYFVKFDDMPASITLNDTITDGLNTYRIRDITDLFGVAYIITVYAGA